MTNLQVQPQCSRSHLILSFCYFRHTSRCVAAASRRTPNVSRSFRSGTALCTCGGIASPILRHGSTVIRQVCNSRPPRIPCTAPQRLQSAARIYSVRWLLFGEQGKIVTISKQRVAALQLIDLGFTATVMVMPGEKVTMLVAALDGTLFEVRTRDFLVACIVDICQTM